MSLDQMKAKLVDLFDVLFHDDNGIVWPTRGSIIRTRSV